MSLDSLLRPKTGVMSDGFIGINGFSDISTECLILRGVAFEVFAIY